MNQEDNILLAKWLEGRLDPSEIDDLSKGVDLSALDKDLVLMADLQLNTNPIDKQWKAFNEKINALKLEFS